MYSFFCLIIMLSAVFFCLILVLRDEFRESPVSVSAVLSGSVTLRCQPPRGTPDPQVLCYVFTHSCT